MTVCLAALAGCGSGDSNDTSGDQGKNDAPAKTVTATTTEAPKLDKAAAKASAARAVEKAAIVYVRRAKDRNLPGPKRVKADCPEPDDDGGEMTCNVVGYTRPVAIYKSDTAPFNVAVADEDWKVTVSPSGKIGKPKIKDAYSISSFLESDDYANCSGGESLNC